MKIQRLDEATFKFYTNGNKTIKVYDGETPPDGFRPGRTFNAKAWNKGLTKETDPRVKAGVEKSVEIRRKNGSYDNPWNKGLTKETDDRLLDISVKVSQSTQGRTPWNKGIPATDSRKEKQSQSMMGKTPYNKGQTKDINPSLKSASDKLLGHKCFVTDWEEAKRKEYLTKKLNGTFNTSRPEKEMIASLIAEFGEGDVIHPYRDERYPFNCDAYIKSLDLFIEFNGTIEHNRRPFDKTNPEHIAEVNRFLKKAKLSGEHSRYWNIIKWWTEIDPKKLETFRKNKLNFKIIYPNNLIIEE